MIRTTTPSQVQNWLNSNEAVILDVREPAEYASEHIMGSILMPLATISSEKLSQYKDKKIILQCRSGKRGGMACDKITELNPALETYNLEGGILAWSQAGYAVQASGKFHLPLDRQVQLTIGLAVLVGSILAYTISPAFLLLTGFFGSGLIFAGLTGFCGLAVIMAKMPWNKNDTLGSSKSCVVK